VSATPPINPVFDRLCAEAAPVVLAGEHRWDEPPVDGGRWPVTVVAVPDTGTRDVLAALMEEALVHTGPGHFETGRASHFTARALEPYREAASPTDPVSGEWAAALDEVGRASAPVTLRLTGVTMSTSGIMVRAEPVGEAPWELMRRLRAALGPLAWFEDQWQERDIWYSSVLHFAAPIVDAPGLVDWVRANRSSLTTEVVLDSLTLTRFRHRTNDGREWMAMEHWHHVSLNASSPS
jgi:hypothetical protein